MYYSIQHTTRFHYSAPISESIMSVRMQPRSENNQYCRRFELTINPRAHVFHYRDHLGNTIHHFDVPRLHTQLNITAKALVEMSPIPLVPNSLGPGAWDELDEMVSSGDYFFQLQPSRFAAPSDLLRGLARELRFAERRDDPLGLLREMTAAIHRRFDYAPQSTKVDSPVDDALRAGKGVCQDFAHIMITLARGLGIPCCYVSGYLVHRVENKDRSAEDATHAWVEALLPQIGWVGFDPTNNLIAGERHIRVAVGRDYDDVPPTRGVFKGAAESGLTVAVQVSPCDAPPPDDPPGPIVESLPPPPPQDQQQQQQQQQ